MPGNGIQKKTLSCIFLSWRWYYQTTGFYWRCSKAPALCSGMEHKNNEDHSAWKQTPKFPWR